MHHMLSYRCIRKSVNLSSKKNKVNNGPIQDYAQFLHKYFCRKNNIKDVFIEASNPTQSLVVVLGLRKIAMW